MLLLLPAPASGKLHEAPDAVPFRLVDDFAIVVPVYVNGRGPYNFLFDTGATLTAVDSSLARELDLEVTGEGVVTGPAGPLAVAVAVARSVKLGPVERLRLEVILRDLGGVRATDPSIQGILGQNALSTVDFLIDYRRKTLQIDRDGALLDSIVGTRLVTERIPLPGSDEYANSAVCAEIDGRGPCATPLLLDTGSAFLVLFGAEDRAGSTTRVLVRDAAGASRPARVESVHLCLQSLCWEKQAQRVDVHGADSAVRGLLPTNLFARLYVSNRFGFLIPDPKPRSARASRGDSPRAPGSSGL